MTAAMTQTRTWLPLLAILLATSMTMERAAANDLGKILGALAVGYVTYEVLDGLDDNSCRPGPSYGPPRAQVVHRNYAPPPPYYHGGEARYWYQEGYQDGFGDGENYGYRNGHEDGFNQGHRVGYHQGTRHGYRVGYGDGYGDGHYDGYRQGVRRPRRRY